MKKTLFLLPIAILALAGCNGNGGGTNPEPSPTPTPTPTPEPAKSWQKVTSAPADGTNYRLALDRGEAETNPGLWYLKDATEGQVYYIATDADVANAAVVEVKNETDGFKVKIGAHYLYLDLVDASHVNNLLKDTEAEGSVFQFNTEYGTLGRTITVSEVSHFYGMGTRNDKTYTTSGGIDIEKYPANYRVYLMEYK